MGLASTASTISKLSDLAEKLYKRVETIRKQLTELRDTVGETNDRVTALERELEEQRALLEAVAAAQDVDVADALAERTETGSGEAGVADGGDQSADERAAEGEAEAETGEPAE